MKPARSGCSPPRPRPASRPSLSDLARSTRNRRDRCCAIPVRGCSASLRRWHGGEPSDRAVPGDQVVLDAGATFTGNFVLAKKAGSGVIVVRTSDIGAVPEGARAGPGDAPHMARIVSPSFDGAVNAAPGAHQWRLIGIE